MCTSNEIRKVKNKAKFKLSTLFDLGINYKTTAGSLSKAEKETARATTQIRNK